MTTATFGTNQVDWEQRLDFDKLRADRLVKLKVELEKSDVGALLAFDFANIRYMSSTHIGTWAIDKAIRFALVTRKTDPIVWDFGSAAKHHQLYNPWLDTTTAEADASSASTMNTQAVMVTNSEREPTLKVCVMVISPKLVSRPRRPPWG